MGRRDLQTRTAEQIREAVTESSVIVLPLGAIEQHGPHLPVNTDTLIADAVATSGAELAAAQGVDVWLLPALTFTKSNEHSHFSGSFSLSASTLMATLDDLARSITMLRARRLVFLNGHGGNSTLVATMNREIRLRYGLQTFLTHPGLPPDQGGKSPASELGMGIHGGVEETSMLLSLRPDLVHMDRATRNVPERLNDNRYVRFGGSVAFGWLADDFGPDGHIGDPTPATAQLGDTLLAGAAEGFAAALGEIATFNFGR